MRLPVFVADPVSCGEGLATDPGCTCDGRGGVAPSPSAMLPAQVKRGVEMHDVKLQPARLYSLQGRSYKSANL